MIDINDLTRKELSENGLSFETSGEFDLFARIISEELERRIRDGLTKSIGKVNAENFILNMDNEESDWFGKYYSEYYSIYVDKQSELISEIIKYKDRIPGILDSPSDVERYAEKQ